MKESGSDEFQDLVGKVGAVCLWFGLSITGGPLMDSV